jgi:hypothetical protein
LENKLKIIELINDWIKSNPTFKKKFLIENIYIIPNKLVQVTTQTTTKINQTTLQRLLPSFFKYLSMDVDKVLVTNLLPDFDLDIEKFIKEYLLSTGLKESEFSIKITNPSPQFTDIEVLADIKVLRLLNLKNLQMNEEGLFLFDLLNKKYKGQISYNLKFTSKLNDSVVELNKEMRRYLQRRNWDIFEPMNPKIGIFKGSTKIDIFINDNGREHYLDRVLDGFFKIFGLNKNYDWTTYRRGPWLDDKEVVYGSKN